MRDYIKVFAPATVANVTCGFDIMGFAVDNPGDEVIMQLSNTPGIRITKITGDMGRLPLDPTKNTVGVSVYSFLKAINSNQGVEIILNKKMPLGSGLGSSAASAVAGVFAINQLLKTNVPPKELIAFAMEGERIACGAAHADNVAPALLGGFALIRGRDPLDVIKILTPSNLYCSIIHPDLEVSTKDARMILRPMVKLEDAVTQWGNVAGLIAGLMLSDYALISRSMHDVIIEPARSILIPGFTQVKQQALENGALGVGISGSGPSIFALSNGIDIAHKVAQAMQSSFDQLKIGHQIYISKINNTGVKIID